MRQLFEVCHSEFIHSSPSA